MKNKYDETFFDLAKAKNEIKALKEE